MHSFIVNKIIIFYFFNDSFTEVLFENIVSYLLNHYQKHHIIPILLRHNILNYKI